MHPLPPLLASPPSTALTMRHVVVDMSTAPCLPDAPAPAQVLERITFETCPGSPLSIVCVRNVSTAVDPKGVYEDSWWTIACVGLPSRFLRLRRGSASLYRLVTRYAFLDSGGCVNHKICRLHYAGTVHPQRLGVDHDLRDATGVPQFYPQSGVCWFASFCWVAFGNAQVRRFMIDHHPEGLKQYARRCLFSRDAAEAYRKRLWYDYAVGDDVDDHPLNDGKNGGAEFVTMCAKFDIPIVRLREEDGMMVPLCSRLRDQKKMSCSARKPRPGEPHLLMLRFIDGDHSNKFPLHRRIHYASLKYRLFGIFQGHRKCEHQCALVCCGESWTQWGMTDADAHKEDIGPCFFEFTPEMSDQWWEKWKNVVNLTKFGSNASEFCPMSPWNVTDTTYDKYKGARLRGTRERAKPPGTLSLDVLYFCDGRDAQSQKK